MARKRLNKKVALIGSAFFVFLVLGTIGVILYLSQDPEKFIEDGDVAAKAADEAIDDQIRAEEYEKAIDRYNKARSLAKTDSLKIKIFFKLVDVHLKTDEWNYVLGCWSKIIQIEPENVKARYGRLKCFYIMANNGARGVWKEIASQASEFIEAVDEDLLTENIAQWESFDVREKPPAKQLGAYLYLLKGRALLEMARMGAVTDPDDSLSRAIDDLEKSRELEPGNVNVYWHLAQAVITKGDIFASRGNLEERDKTREQAEQRLEQAVEIAGADPSAHINLLVMKPVLTQMTGREWFQSLEPEYLSLVDKFPSSAQTHSALAGFYLRLGPKHLDKAIEAIEKAIELDRENVAYAIIAANLYYRRSSIYGQKQGLYKAIEVAQNTLKLPDAQEETGPRRRAVRMNRISLYAFLANCYIEQIFESQRTGIGTDLEKQEWLTNAEQAVHEIEQLFGSGEEPQVVKWRGMLELAKGNKNIAIRKLYATYEQLKAAGQRDAQLSYTLAKLFENTTELGAVNEFFISALSLFDRNVPDKIDETRPDALLDYAEVLLRLESYRRGLNVIDFFENGYWTNERSKTLRIKALIGARQFDEAEKELAGRPEPDDPNTIKLNIALVRAKILQIKRTLARKQVDEGSDWLSDTEKTGAGLATRRGEAGALPETSGESMAAELQGHLDVLIELTEKLLPIDTNAVEGSMAVICNNYIAAGKIEQALAIVNKFLEYSPDNTLVLFYEKLLFEPEPHNVSRQRRREIRKAVLSGVDDPTLKAVKLGVFYQQGNEPNEAAAEFKKVLKAEAWQEGREITDFQRLAVGYLFDIAIETKNWELAEQVAELVQRRNMDECNGQFFAARLAIDKEEYEDAMTRIEECLKQRAVFSHGFMLRSNINAALGNEDASLKDVQKAAYLNPLDKDIARGLAFVLYRRNQKLGDNVSSDQMIETRDALIKAIRLSPRQWQLQSFYAEYVSRENPEEALAIRQRLQKALPSVANALLLGRMAMRMALSETDTKRKELLFGITASAFKQARTMEPQNKAVLDGYAEYYRLTGQGKKAEELLVQSQDKRLLLRHHFRAGQLDEARRVAEELYNADSKDIVAVKSLLLIAEATIDREAVEKYSEKLLLLEDDVENRLVQIQALLKVGLVKEAEHKLQSFREKYPDEPRALLLRAWLVMKQGRLKKALELINQSLQSDQNNPMAWRLRGEMKLFMANYEQAIIDLRKSKSLSNDPLTRLSLAKAYLRMGREDDAVIELKNMIDLPKAPVESRILLGRIYLRLGRKKALDKFYDETLDKFPESVFWHNEAGAYALAAGYFDKAERLYKQAWQKGRKYSDNDTGEALHGYLRSLMLAEKLDKLFEEAGKYVDGDFAPIAFIGMAGAKLKLGNRADAVQYSRKALSKAFARTEQDLAAWVLQRVYLLLGAEEVRKYCKERLEADPDSLAANFTMYSLTRVNGEYNKAVDYIDKCLQIIETPPETGQRRVEYVVQKAETLQLAYNKTSDRNYLDRAVEAYESLLAEMPNNIDALNNLAYMLAENNERLTEALRYIERVHEIRPNNPGFLDTYAYVLYRNQRLSEAAEFLQAALLQYDSQGIGVPADVYEHLGMIEEKLGNRPQALAAYEQALQVGQDTLSEAVKERFKAAVERLSQR